MPDRFADLLHRHLPRQCRATTRAGRQCKNRAQPRTSFCQVHADWTLESEPLDSLTFDAFLTRHLVQAMVDAGLITLAQLALVRVGIGVVVGLTTWLLYTLLMWISTGWFHLPLAAWYTAAFAFLLTCWLLGRLVARVGILTSLYVLLLLLTSILLDFFNKDGLIANICFLFIPFGLPVFILYRYELSLWWGCLLFPIGFVVGKFYYNRLEAASA